MVDGDTFWMEWSTELGYGDWFIRHRKLRLHGCDAPKNGTPEGDASTAFARELLPLGTIVRLTRFRPDVYHGRFSADVQLPDGRDLKTVMVEAGHAVPWDGTGVRPAGLGG